MTLDPLAFVEAGRTVSIEEARAQIYRAIVRYLSTPDPAHILLVKAPPGVGKSYAGVQIGQEFANAEGYIAALRALRDTGAQGKRPRVRRVLYAGPRRDLFESLAGLPPFQEEAWYAWQSRSAGDPTTGAGQNCRYTPQMATWLHRGYNSADFCRQICGREYMEQECSYLLQQKRREPLIYGNHRHIFLNHPLQFHLVIGDENPLEAVLHPWTIPADGVFSGEHDPFRPTPGEQLLRQLQIITRSGEHLEGPALLTALGGAARVRALLEGITLPDLDHLRNRWERIHKAGESAGKPFWHLTQLTQLLLRETEWAERGEDYLTRVIVHDGQLHLLLRHDPNPKLPSHIVWLDATGNDHLYEAMFRRPVVSVAPQVKRVGRVIQITDRANGKRAMLDEEGALTASATSLRRLVDHIVENDIFKDGVPIKVGRYERVGVYTFKDLKEALWGDSGYQIGTFGSETGINAFQGNDALFVLHTYMPPPAALQSAAKMLFWERMLPFQDTWSTVAKPYENHWTTENPRVGGYHSDPDLQAVLWQLREAKIIQTAERLRANLHAVDVWLATNLPIREYPPDILMTMNEVLGVPTRQEVARVIGRRAARDFRIPVWQKVVEAAEELLAERGYIKRSELEERAQVGEHTALDFMKLMAHKFGWEFCDEPVLTRGRGRPAQVLVLPERGRN